MANLPNPATSFIGRARELGELVTLLERKTDRLVVMTGPGGVGKTRLAVEAATVTAPRFRDGVVFVDLSTLNESSPALDALANALELPEAGSNPVEARLIDYFKTRKTLVVLDNFEAVAAAPRVAAVAAEAPHVVFLITSRIRLRVAGARDVPVEPMSLPADGAAAADDAAVRSDAVRLFLARAKEAGASIPSSGERMAAVVAICRRVQGLPLAIELAAARLRFASPDEVLAQLDLHFPDRAGSAAIAPARPRTMHDAVAWSYNRLDPPLQALLRRLAVFQGGFDVAAAEAVAIAPFSGGGWDQAVVGASPMVFHQLQLLVDHSLIRVEAFSGASRYAMLDEIRDFGWEALREKAEVETVRRAHADHFLMRLDQTRPLLFTRSFRQAIGALIVDQHNFRAALAWAEERGEIAMALRLCVGLSEYWYQCGFVAAGRERIETLLDRETPLTPERQPALGLATLLAWLQGDNEGARCRATEALALSEALGSRWLAATIQNLMALIEWQAGNAAAMRNLANAALPVTRETGDAVQESVALITLAIADRLDGELASAHQLFEQARDLADRIGFLWLAAAASYGCGEVDLDAGREDAATRHFHASLAVTAELGASWGVGAAIGGLACVAIRRRDAELAARLFGAADGLMASGRTFLPTLDPVRYAKLRETAQHQAGKRAFARLTAEGRKWTIAEAVAEASRLTADSLTVQRSARSLKLPPRQIEVLRGLAAGKSAREIAGELGISVNTVNDHIKKIRDKSGVSGHAAMIALAHRLDLAP